MDSWTSGEVLGFDFETTGVDRFSDVPVSYALVYVVGGIVVRSWSGLIDPGREIPRGGHRGARNLDRAGPRRGHAFA